MTIVPISLKNSSSVVEFFKHGGQVEIELRIPVNVTPWSGQNGLPAMRFFMG